MIAALLLILGFQAPPMDGQGLPERIPLEQILSGNELREYQSEARYRGRIEVLRKSIERKSKLLNSLVSERKLTDIYRCLAELRGLSFHALQLSLEEKQQKELQHREVKRLEILLRKLGDDLQDHMMAVPLETRYHFEDTMTLTEELRNRLLKQLFGQAIGYRQAGAHMPIHGLLPSHRIAGNHAAVQRGLWDLDKFTEEEFLLIQENQQLDKRVEKFLAIARARLDEVDRRRAGLELEENELNPLEFFTYADLLFGYSRAIDGIMINIDSQVEASTAEEKHVRKALELLKTGLEDFQPRLAALQDLIREQRDLELYEQYQKALKSSEKAYSGASYGLESLSRAKD